MPHKRPRSPSPEPAPYCPAQAQGPSSAMRRHLHEFPRNEAQVPPNLEGPTPAAREELISMVVLLDLLLEPQLTSVTQVELPGFTLILVPEGLPLSALLGQPEFSSTSPQEAALLQTPQDQLVVLPGELVQEISYQEDACAEDQNSGFMTPWIGAPPGEASEPFSSTNRTPSPCTLDYSLEPQLQVLSPNAARNIWDLDRYLLGPFPTSPLHPLPPSTPPSPEEQQPARPSSSPPDPSKPGGDCSMNELPRTNPEAPQVKGFQEPLCVPFRSLQGCIRPDLRKEQDSRAQDFSCSACPISTVCSAPCASSPCSFDNMQHKRPRSPSPEPVPCWAPQPQGPSSAKRSHLHEPAQNEPTASPDEDAPTSAASEEFISVVVLLHLVLVPQPTSVTQVELPGFTLILVPEGLPLSALLGQPEDSSTSPQEDALLQTPQDQLVVLPGELVQEISYQEDACAEDQNSGFMTPWIGAPPGEASEPFSSSNRTPSPWAPNYNLEPQLQVLSPNAARNIWDLDRYLLGPFATSPLQPLPPSPPPSPEEQRPAHPSSSPPDPSKPGGDCSMNELPRTNPEAPQVKGFQEPLCVPFRSLQGCIRPDLRKEQDSRAQDFSCSACPISTVCSAPCASSPCSFNNMQHKRPRSPSPEPLPCWAPQPQGPSSAKRSHLHEPAQNEPTASPDQDAPTSAASEEFISVVVLLHLVLQPQPTSVTQVELPGFTLILVPEGLPLSAFLGQPEDSSTSPQEDALLQMAQDQLVVLPGELVQEISYQEDACAEDQNSGFMTPWIGAPPGEASEPFSSSNRTPSPWTPNYNLEPQLQVLSPNAARNIWDLDSYLLGPFATSPLQPLPPSPPPSPQVQHLARPARPARPSRAPCKARRRLFYE